MNRRMLFDKLIERGFLAEEADDLIESVDDYGNIAWFGNLLLAAFAVVAAFSLATLACWSIH